MTSKPDAKRRKRAEAQLRRKNEPRRLDGFGERRLSVAEEETEIALANRRNGTALRSDVAATLGSILTELEYVKATLGRVAPGDHRGYFREIEHGIKGLQRAL